MNFAAIILAAGYSSRIGGFKPLMELGGQSLLGRSIALFRQAGIARISVVTGHRHTEVKAEAARFGISCIHNLDYSRGMYASVCAAVSHLSGIDGFFLLPVDIPLIRPATIEALIAAFVGQAVVYPCFNGLRGHPPLIPAMFIPAILGHSGEGGLKALLEEKNHLDIAVWDQSILFDADTPNDFAMLGLRLARMTIGTPAEALALATLTMPERGVAHGLAVALVAKQLTEELNCHGYNLDLDLVNNGALLHDIAKGQPQHEIRGGQILHRLGLPQLAEIVAAHRDISPPLPEHLTEKEVVYLADKLVRGTLRVSVQQRFAEKLELYAESQETCRAINSRLANALAVQSLVEAALGTSIEEFLDGEQCK
ncbi:MAG: NTP transferase domain-containing protein [Pseudomonadota bacterium]